MPSASKTTLMLVASIAAGRLVQRYLAKQKMTTGERSAKPNAPRNQEALIDMKTGKKKMPRVAVNKEFFRRLKGLVKIVIPGFKSKEFLLLIMHTSFLVARTLCSIYVASLDGAIVKTIVDRKFEEFIKNMFKWILLAVPATYINSMLRFLESKLALAFRTRLVEKLYKMYMQSETYYRVDNLDSRLQNADQSLTQDVSNWCSEAAQLYSHLSKPCLDIVLMSIQLIMLSKRRDRQISKASGAVQGSHWKVPTAVAACAIGISGLLLKMFTPPFGRLVAEEAKLYGELRAVHARVITHSEEIAFYGGHEVEHGVLWKTYSSLVKHMNKIYRVRIGYTMLEQFLMKYVWGAAGLIMIAIPQFNRAKMQLDLGSSVDASSRATAVDLVDTVADRTEEFITARGLLVSAADAIERVMSSWKQIAELAGHTQRVWDMFTIFEEVKQGVYVKVKVGDDGKTDPAALLAEPALSSPGKGSRGVNTKASDLLGSPRANKTPNVVSKAKIVENSTFVKCVDLPVVTPNGDVLIHSPGFNFQLNPGMHLLIMGPNGCGKSSLFRIMGNLWPVKSGTLHRPAKKDMFYIPQRPYLSEGTLREQFIYPHSTSDMIKKGIKDEYLSKVLEWVDLKYVLDREEKGFDTYNDWRDVLSGGEKQRVAMARLFYHMPKFALLDECTSAVSMDVEGLMYNKAKELGITLLTVTHRPSLWKHHTHLLRFDGAGSYTFGPLKKPDARLSLEEEKISIEAQLNKIPNLEVRLAELHSELGLSADGK